MDNNRQVKTQEILTNLHTLETSAFLFQEINTDFKLRTAQDEFNQTIRKFYPNNYYIPSNSSIFAPTTNWLPGGTMAGLLHKWTGAKISSGTDRPLGRWSWITIQGCQNKVITLVSAYRVNPGRQSMGSYSTFKQQYHIMLQQNIDHPDPRQQALLDFQAFLKEKIDQKEEIIVSIGANETMDQNQSDPSSFFSMTKNLGLINLAETLPKTHESHTGGRFIDFCLVTPNLLPAVESFGYLPYTKITTTDHRLNFLDLNIPTLFNRNSDSQTTYPSRILKTHLPKRTKNYVENVQQNFKKTHLLKAACNLQQAAQTKGKWDNELQQKYDNIDNTVTEIMIKAEATCAPKYPSLTH